MTICGLCECGIFSARLHPQTIGEVADPAKSDGFERLKPYLQAPFVPKGLTT
jgi:hypothetical protein